MQVRLTQFEGPLDILLDLIEKQKLSISDISLAQIADQYVEFINNNKHLPFGTLIYFIDIATRLVVLKSRVLLPYTKETDEDETEDLVKQLQKYKMYRDRARAIKQYLRKNSSRLYPTTLRRNPPALALYQNLITSEMLHYAIKKLFVTLVEPAPHTTIRRIFNIQDTMKRIVQFLQYRSHLSLRGVVNPNSTKTEVIISFLALLELMKLRVLSLNQDAPFADIIINETPTLSYAP